MNTILAIFVIVLGVFLIALGGAILSHKPFFNLVFFDRGHRCLGVPAAYRQVTIDVLSLNDLKPYGRFTSGPTDQTIMDDGFTVINVVEPNFLGPSTSTGKRATAISLPVKDPYANAGTSVKMYKDAGAEASYEEVSGDTEHPIVVIHTTAHPEFELVLRHDIKKMPQPTWIKP